MNSPSARRLLRWTRTLTAALLAFGMNLPLGGSLVLELNLVQLEDRAATVVHGKCIAKKEVPDGQPLPYTEYTFEVLRAVKGCRNASGETLERIVFRHAGTEHGVLRADGTETAPLRLGLPTHALGEETVLFLTRESKAGLCSPVGLSLGKFVVERKDGRALVANTRGKKLFQDVAPASFAALSPVEASVLETSKADARGDSIELESFLGLCGKVKAK